MDSYDCPILTPSEVKFLHCKIQLICCSKKKYQDHNYPQ